jgi:translation initiation factor 3 subunit E
MAKWELTSQLSPYLDRHLVIPLLEFHTVNGMYDATDLSKGKLTLLANTSMVDYCIEEHTKLYPNEPVPQEMKDKRKAVVEEFRSLQEETKPLLDIFAEPAVTVQVSFYKQIVFVNMASIFKTKIHYNMESFVSKTNQQT